MNKISEGMSWLREHRKDWPFLVAINVIIFNTEVAIAFILKPVFGFTGSQLGIAAGLWATSELTWWNWFSGWFYRSKIKKLGAVNEAIALGREAKDFDFIKFLEPKKGDPSLIAEIKKFIKKHAIDNFDIDEYNQNSFFKSLVSTLIFFGYVLACALIFVLACLPIWWILALMICRFLRWRSAFVTLYIGNFIKNYFLAYFYEELGFWQWLAMLVIAVSVMGYILRKITKLHKKP